MNEERSSYIISAGSHQGHQPGRFAGLVSDKQLSDIETEKTPAQLDHIFIGLAGPGETCRGDHAPRPPGQPNRSPRDQQKHGQSD
jgi:hypothetical protein